MIAIYGCSIRREATTARLGVFMQKKQRVVPAMAGAISMTMFSSRSDFRVKADCRSSAEDRLPALG
jgi:hypothetical protein